MNDKALQDAVLAAAALVQQRASEIDAIAKESGRSKEVVQQIVTIAAVGNIFTKNQEFRLAKFKAEYGDREGLRVFNEMEDHVNSIMSAEPNADQANTSIKPGIMKQLFQSLSACCNCISR